MNSHELKETIDNAETWISSVMTETAQSAKSQAGSKEEVRQKSSRAFSLLQTPDAHARIPVRLNDLHVMRSAGCNGAGKCN